MYPTFTFSSIFIRGGGGMADYIFCRIAYTFSPPNTERYAAYFSALVKKKYLAEFN